MTKIMDAIMGTAGRVILTAKDAGKLDAVTVVAATLDSCLHVLSDPETTPDGRLNHLAGLMWQLCGSKTVSTAATDEVETLSFMALNDDEKLVGAVLVPDDWAKMFAINPWMQVGGVVHVSSKARDFWNGRILDVDVDRRARAFEALLFRLAAKDESTTRKFSANDYQKKVLAEFEAGIPDSLFRDSMPFDLDRARSGFKSFSKLPIQMPSGGRG